MARMDLVAACRAFVSVSDRGSFTTGAAAAGMQQAVASRRIAALESAWGERLFDRTARGARLTAFGRSMLPAARQLASAAEEIEEQARRARAGGLRIALPPELPPTSVAGLIGAVREAGIRLDVEQEIPRVREERVRAGLVDAAVLPVAPDEASWSVPLVAAGRQPGDGPFFLDAIRPRRGRSGDLVRLLLLAEDDVPDIRDRLDRLRDSHGLAPAQLVTAPSLPRALADVAAGDLLICSAAQATWLGLHGRPLGDLRLARSYALTAAEASEHERVRALVGPAVPECLGAPREVAGVRR
jgi:DNA-binding transcriptional LysR family regulator